MPSRVPIVTVSHLKTLPARALVARLRNLHACEEDFSSSDRCGHETEPVAAVTQLIEFKRTLEWNQAYIDVKNVLREWGHVPRSRDRKRDHRLRGKMKRDRVCSRRS